MMQDIYLAREPSEAELQLEAEAWGYLSYDELSEVFEEVLLSIYKETGTWPK